MTPRVVFDTNVILSALVFRSGRMAPLAHEWRAGRCVPLGSSATIGELLRALAYPRFGLGADEMEALLGDYVPFVEVVPGVRRRRWRKLTDPDDAMVLDLGAAGRADVLVTGDRALLRATPPSGCRIIRPAEFLAR